MLPWAGQAKHAFDGARAGYSYIGHIFVLPPKWGYVSVCEIVGRPSCISLSSFCWWTGLVTLEGEFCGSSFDILEIEGDSKVFSSLSHWRTGTVATVSIPLKLQPWFLSLRLKTCLWAELQPWCLSLQWKTCPWVEHSDDDNILIFLGDLLPY